MVKPGTVYVGHAGDRVAKDHTGCVFRKPGQPRNVRVKRWRRDGGEIECTRSPFVCKCDFHTVSDTRVRPGLPGHGSDLVVQRDRGVSAEIQAGIQIPELVETAVFPDHVRGVVFVFRLRGHLGGVDAGVVVSRCRVGCIRDDILVEERGLQVAAIRPNRKHGACKRQQRGLVAVESHRHPVADGLDFRILHKLPAR